MMDMRRSFGLIFLLALCAVVGPACESSGGEITPTDVVDSSGLPGDVVLDDMTPPEDVPPLADSEDPPCECDDQILCTADECDEDGTCMHPSVTLGEAPSLPAPLFDLVDKNPESATFDQSVSLADWKGKVVVLLFHSAACPSCKKQGELARAFWEEIKSDDAVWFGAINDLDGAAVMDDYVNADDPELPGALAPPSRWPVLQDTAAVDAWMDYCADNGWVYVVDSNGLVHYMREVNFGDSPFVGELRAAIARAKTGGEGK